MAQTLKLYEQLVQLKDNPEEFEARVDDIWASFYKTLSPGQEKHARQFRWEIDRKLRKFKDPQARMNEMTRLFWQGFQAFQLSLTNPNQFIAKSQDGSRAVVLPINKTFNRE